MKYTTLSKEETRERVLRRIVGYLSGALIIAMAGWALYFWHLYQIYRGH